MSTVRVEPADRLSSVLFGKTRRRLLGWLFGHPDESFYVRQLVRITGASPGALVRELDELTAAGILSRSPKGRAVFYQVDPRSPIFRELQGIILKTAGVVAEIRRALKPLASRIDIALLHGSVARGALQSASDVDVVVVADASFADVVEALALAQRRLGREINPVVYSAGEFKKKVRSGHHFLTTVLRAPRTFILGGENELGQLVPKRVAGPPPNVRGRNSRPTRGR